MKKITDNLWQGASDEAKLETLQELNITAIVSVGVDRPELEGIRTHYEPIVEFSAQKEHWTDLFPRVRMRNSTDEEVIAATELVRNLINGNEKVFLHCDAGICRSIGIGALYLLRSGLQPTIETAYTAMGSRLGSNDKNQNPFISTVVSLAKRQYWTEFDLYLDQLHWLASGIYGPAILERTEQHLNKRGEVVRGGGKDDIVMI